MNSPRSAIDSDEFDVVILGGGAGAKMIWGSVGQRAVAVVEQSRVGGACPFVACVPSKAMLRTARVWQLGADPPQSALFTGRVPAAEAYRLACQRRDTIDSAIAIDDHCRVVNAEHLWAIGDVTGKSAFTHTSHYQGRVVVAANLRGHSVCAHYAFPRAVYVEPTLASVGHTVASARHAGIEPITASSDMRTAAVRSTTDGQSAGWVNLLADPATSCIIGATGMGQNAEEWIAVLSQAIRAATPVALLADVVHPFPSFGEVLENPLWELRDALQSATVTDDRPRADSAVPIGG